MDDMCKRDWQFEAMHQPSSTSDRILNVTFQGCQSIRLSRAICDEHQWQPAHADSFTTVRPAAVCRKVSDRVKLDWVR